VNLIHRTRNFYRGEIAIPYTTSSLRILISERSLRIIISSRPGVPAVDSFTPCGFLFGFRTRIFSFTCTSTSSIMPGPENNIAFCVFAGLHAAERVRILHVIRHLCVLRVWQTNMGCCGVWIVCTRRVHATRWDQIHERRYITRI